MAILTLDDVIAGRRQPQTLLKIGTTMEAIGVAHSFFYTNGRPGAGAAPSPGVNGAALTGNAVQGQIPRTNPASGNAHLMRLAANANVAGTLWLCDRLWHNSGLSVTATTPQAITPATLPPRDLNGTTDGEDVMAAVEWRLAGGAGTPTVTLTYTNSAGDTLRTGTFVGAATPAAGTFEIFNMADGDTGVRAPTSFQQSATRTSGTMHLILFRLLATLDITTANVGNTIDALTSGFPRLYDGTVPFLVWWPTATTALQLRGQYIECHG